MNDINDMYKITEKEQAEKAWPNGEQPITNSVSFKFKKGRLKLYCSTKGTSIACRHSKLSRQEIYTVPLENKNQYIEAKAVRYGYQEPIKTLYKN